MTSPILTGLSDEEVINSRIRNGSNIFHLKEERNLLHTVKDVLLEPMFILLLIACTVYFLIREYEEGIIMLISILIVSGISFFQEYRSRNAIQALKKLSAPKVKVIRNGEEITIASEEIVVHDIMRLEEGENISCDGKIITANDFSVNESLITGESFAVYKNTGEDVFKGTLVTSGAATIKVSTIGNKTMFGKIGLSLQEIEVVKTPLQKQIQTFVRRMVWFGVIAFVLVFTINYYHSGSFSFGLLQGLTLAMSVLPEEIPVAFSAFQALGAFRLLKNNIIVKQPQFVETLGSATVICIDKTGTITQNLMHIEFVYDEASKQSIQNKGSNELPRELIEYAMWSSETEPFDPMEKAIHDLYQNISPVDKRLQYKQVHEYPIGGKPPMMTHIFKNDNGETVIAAKGAPEAILRNTCLPVAEIKRIEEQSLGYAKQGYRVLGVGKGIWNEKHYPVSQEEFRFEFLGLIAFNDPPKPNMIDIIQTFHRSGIQIKIITGDYAETAVAIAKQIKLNGSYEFLTGKEVLQLSPEDLRQKVKHVNIYARMFPEAKLKVISALKENGEVVAMTGDGVNDTPALKAAHIGIAMGQRGSEAAKSVASIVITDDDLMHMTDAVALGRKIYGNLKKAIQYIVSIHIPIILIVTLPLLFMWKFVNFFSPVHVIFLELIMGPTCSIIYENEPIEPGTMQRPPRKLISTFLSGKQLQTSIAQGLIITAGCLGMGYYFMQHHYDEATVRTVIFITLLFSNIFLTLVNRSFKYSVATTIRYKNYMVPIVILATLAFIFSLLFIPFIRTLFLLETISLYMLLTCFTVALISTMWIEFFKQYKKYRPKTDQ
jgi:Ca2+-transporting ATPase